VGFDNDAVQWTANIFNPGFTGAYLGTIAKSINLQWVGGSFWQWGGLIGTLQPRWCGPECEYLDSSGDA